MNLSNQEVNDWDFIDHKEPERIGAWYESALVSMIETAPIDERERHYLILEVHDGIGIERAREIELYIKPILNNPITHGRCYTQTEITKELKLILNENR